MQKSQALHSMRITRIRFVTRITRFHHQRQYYYHCHHQHHDHLHLMPLHASFRCLAERVRAASLDGSGQEARVLRPVMPDIWMIKQALSEVYTRHVIDTDVLANSQFLTPCVQQGAADVSSSSSAFGGSIEAEVSLLRLHLRLLPCSLPPPSLCDHGDGNHNDDAAHPLLPATAFSCTSRCPVPVSFPALTSNAAAALSAGGVAGKRETQISNAQSPFAAVGEHAPVVDSGVYCGPGFQCMLGGWCGRVVKALRWLRLLNIWQPLRRAASAALQAVMRVLHAGGSGSGTGTARGQQMVLAFASIVLMVIHMQSYGV
jgi:hypothetical protein